MDDKPTGAMDVALLERLVRVETKLDSTLGTLKGETAKRLDNHEERIRKVERVLWVVTGAAAAVGSAVGSVLVRVIGG